MKRIIKAALAGILAVCGVSSVSAATTNYWVQSVTLRAKAYVQLNNRVIRGPLPSKQFLAFLSGARNPSLVTTQTVSTVTNNFFTNATVLVTNSWLLPQANDPADLPRGYTYTGNYVVTNGGFSFTNNIQFTNDVVVTRSATTNVTYTFNNVVIVPTNRTAYLVPELPGNNVTAVWTNLPPGSVYLVSGPVMSNTVRTVTNTVSGTNIDFTTVSGAKLIYKTLLLDGTNYGSSYAVRYRSGRDYVDVDVGNLLSEGEHYLTLADSVPLANQTRYFGFNEVDFNNGLGTSFNLVGFDTQTWTIPSTRGNVIKTPVLKQRTLSFSNFEGSITAKIGDRNFFHSPALLDGTLIIGGGRLE